MLYNPFTIQTAHAATKIQDAGAILNQAAGPTGVQQVPLLDMVAAVMQALLGMVGIVFFILIVYGAYLWFAAAGADEKTKKGRGVIITAISGLMIVLAAGALSGFVFEKLTVGNITSPSVADLSTPWGGPVGGVQGPKPGEVTGCCIDRVGEYNFARRVTSEADCISNQGKNDAYSIDLAGEQKTGDAASGVRGEDWDFYAGKNTEECEEIFTCWDKKLGFLWGGMNDEEFQQCLAGFGLNKVTTEMVWCYTVDRFELDEVTKEPLRQCQSVSSTSCAQMEGINFEDDEMACQAKKDQDGGGKGFVWCFAPDTKVCRLILADSCVAPMQKAGYGDSGKTACAGLGGKVDGYSCRYEKKDATPTTLGLGAVCIPCDCQNTSPKLNYGCDLGGTTMKLWGQYLDEKKCQDSIIADKYSPAKSTGFCFKDSQSCTACSCVLQSDGKLCEDGAFFFSTELACQAIYTTLSAVPLIGAGTAVVSCGGSEIGKYPGKGTLMYSELSSGEMCNGNNELLFTAPSISNIELFCKNCKIADGLCKAKQAERPKIDKACEYLCGGTSECTIKSGVVSGNGWSGLKIAEVCRREGSVLIPGQNSSDVYCFRKQLCENPKLEGICKWGK
ncbi:MAG TPA: hypothetical protein PLV72_01955 [Candidatus Magasanikbacteria bacterium]|nr:hypothetical protein [Candidatus Magasanikbacteria bacterium]